MEGWRGIGRGSGFSCFDLIKGHSGCWLLAAGGRAGRGTPPLALLCLSLSSRAWPDGPAIVITGVNERGCHSIVSHSAQQSPPQVPSNISGLNTWSSAPKLSLCPSFRAYLPLLPDHPGHLCCVLLTSAPKSN